MIDKTFNSLITSDNSKVIDFVNQISNSRINLLYTSFKM